MVAYIALHNDYSEDFHSMTSLDEAECGRICVKRLLQGNRNHWGPLEHPSLTLALQADHNTIMQLRTHRISSHDVQSMRYTGSRIEKVASGEIPPEDAFYVRPPGKYRDRQGDPYEWTEQDVEESLALAVSSAMDYAALRRKGVSEEQARGVLITSYFQNDVVTFNLRGWLHLLDIRLKLDAQWEMRCLMELVALQVQRWAPEVYGWWADNRRGKAMLAP
jgi:thymidylate synthase (FAD)